MLKGNFIKILTDDMRNLYEIEYAHYKYILRYFNCDEKKKFLKWTFDLHFKFYGQP